MSTREGAGASRRRRPGSESGLLASARVAEIQRGRLLGAMAEVAGERGAANATVAHVVSRAGVSRRTFYELFADREDCFMAAFEQAIARAEAVVLPAYGSPAQRWAVRIRSGLFALLRFFDEEPGLARLCVVEALGGGPRALARRRRILAALIAAVDGGRSEPRQARPADPPARPPGREPPPLTAEGVVGAVFAILHARLLAGGSKPLTDLLGELMGVIVLPYLGPAAADRELHKPAPPNQKKKARSPRDPLQGLNMRLTYRTLRVLAEVERRPGASNRVVAQAAEIADQGQMSKLLARLEDLGLIANTGAGHAKGARNEWILTERGQQVAQSMG